MKQRNLVMKNGDLSNEIDMKERTKAISLIADCSSFVLIAVNNTDGNVISCLNEDDISSVKFGCRKILGELSKSQDNINRLKKKDKEDE